MKTNPSPQTSSSSCLHLPLAALLAAVALFAAGCHAFDGGTRKRHNS
ncbi:MAG: hypothetical protein HZA92_19250, partial [Verrucomicrobia bacterium]|nr:hypothetical protein [Verrucomicrobiota bacterium]